MSQQETLPLIRERKQQDGTISSPGQTFGAFLSAFWPLAFISFGGPAAHVSLLHAKFVDVPPDSEQPKVPESTFMELYALAQALPGPGSTQLVVSLGATFGGILGSIITFLVWHLPGFFIMTFAGVWFHNNLKQEGSEQLIQTLTDYSIGLISAAFAFVLMAAYKIVGAICGTDRMKVAIMLVSTVVAVLIPPAASSWVFILLLILGGLSFYIYEKIVQMNGQSQSENTPREWSTDMTPLTGAILILVVVVVTLVISFLPPDNLGIVVLKNFWRIGLCVFGGGIVVVPMLLNDFVESGLLPTTVFLAGFGLFGCIPGPMFNLAPFMGAAILSWKGAFYGSFGLFGPGVLLQIGLLPFWERIRRIETVQTVLQGTNSAASGLIMAGVWMLLRKALVGPAAYSLTVTATAAALVYKVKPALNIIIHGVAGFLLVSLGLGAPFHSA